MMRFILQYGIIIGVTWLLSSCSATAMKSNTNSSTINVQGEQTNVSKGNEVYGEDQYVASKNKEEDYSTKEWQDSFKEVAIVEAESFVQLSEKKGGLSEERIREYSKVVLQQADRIIDEQFKKDMITLSGLIKDNQLTEIKLFIRSMNSN